MKVTLIGLITLAILCFLAFRYFGILESFDERLSSFDERLSSYGYPYYWKYHNNRCDNTHYDSYDRKNATLTAGNVIILE